MIKTAKQDPRLTPSQPALDRFPRTNRIFALRKSLGYTQRHLAERLHLQDPRLIRRWESGESLPSIRYAFALARALRHSTEDVWPELKALVEAQDRGETCRQRGETPPSWIHYQASKSLLAIWPGARYLGWASFVSGDLRAWGASRPTKRRPTSSDPLGESVARLLEDRVSNLPNVTIAVEHRTDAAAFQRVREVQEAVSRFARCRKVPLTLIDARKMAPASLEGFPRTVIGWAEDLVIRFPCLFQSLRLDECKDRFGVLRYEKFSEHKRAVIAAVRTGVLSGARVERKPVQSTRTTL